jgi:thiol-disulfide isomerase/thioredoxin
MPLGSLGMKRAFWFVLVSFVAIGLFGIGYASDMNKITDIKAGYVGIDGLTASLGAMKGKPVLLTFWASWCGPCIAEVPTLNEIHQKYGNRGLQVLGISVDAGSADQVRQFAEKYHMHYRVGIARADLIKELSIGVIPISLLFDPDGSLLRQYTGQPPSEVLMGDIDKAMASQK